MLPGHLDDTDDRLDGSINIRIWNCLGESRGGLGHNSSRGTEEAGLLPLGSCTGNHWE